MNTNFESKTDATSLEAGNFKRAQGEQSPCHLEITRQRSRMFSIEIDQVTRSQAVGRVLDAFQEAATEMRYVVTPNVDHLVQLAANSRLRQAYASAWMVLADGHPVVWASRLLGQPLPERVAGSDLVPDVLAALASFPRPANVYLLGGAAGVPEMAAAAIATRWPWVKIAGICSPEWGFETSAVRNREIVRAVNRAQPDLLLVGLGAPKQELWLHAHHHELQAKVAIAAGATIDFLAGKQTRAPHWLQRCGLEWFFRWASDPRRLTGRYARDAVVFPWLLARERWSQSI